MTNKFHVVDVSTSIPPVLLPIFGFANCTAPELTLEHRDIKEANFEYPRKVFDRATVNNVVLSRGAQLQDSDFWTWANNYVEGNREKKNLMIIQSTAIDSTIGQGGAIGLPTIVEIGATVPGRAWVLRNCSPGRYKTAGDMDARESAISIMELEIVYEYFVDFNMGL